MQWTDERSDEILATRLGRRELLVGAGALAAGVGVAAAAEHDQHGQDHAAHKYAKAERYGRRADLVAATETCMSKGRQCLSHCMEMFLTGDTTMAECAAAVEQMLPVCNAMAHLAANDSAQLAAMAQACIAVCEHCEKECRVHQDHQPECRACADACAALIVEAKKVVA
jgi:Cys-rich four helix bundle protein (predicted Tat secretion target)